MLPGAEPPGDKGPEAVGLLPLAPTGERVAGPGKPDEYQPEHPKITRITAKRQQTQNDQGDDGHGNPAGKTRSSERGCVVPFEILGQLLKLKRRFSSRVSYRFHDLPRFDLTLNKLSYGERRSSAWLEPVFVPIPGKS